MGKPVLFLDCGDLFQDTVAFYEPFRITYRGKKQNAKGRDFKVFTVETGKKRQTPPTVTASTPTEEAVE